VRALAEGCTVALGAVDLALCVPSLELVDMVPRRVPGLALWLFVLPLRLGPFGGSRLRRA